MIKDIYYKYSQNQSKIDLLFSSKSFKEETIKDLVLETSRAYSSLLRRNKPKEVTLLKTEL